MFPEHFQNSALTTDCIKSCQIRAEFYVIQYLRKRERGEGKCRDEKRLDKLLSEVLKCKISFRAVAGGKAFYRSKENTVHILSATMTWKL